MHYTKFTHPRRAFTLIELLTVIAIIGILAAILIPTVGRVRDTAKSGACASNLRQLSAAALLYANENKQRLVPVWMGANDPDMSDWTWRRILEPYLGSRRDSKSALICPADVFTEFPDSSSGGAWPASYGINLASQSLGSTPLYRYGSTTAKLLTAIREPSRMIMMADSGTGGSGSAPTDPTAWVDSRTAYNAFNRGYVRMPWGGNFNYEWSVWPRHGGKRKANCAFYDGSVRSLDLIADLKDHPDGDPLCLFDNH